LPVVPVTSLEALAFPAIEAGADRVIACLDARMGEIYWGCFAAIRRRGLRALGSLQVTPADLAYACRAQGAIEASAEASRRTPSSPRLRDVEVDARSAAALPNAADMARLGALRLAAGEGVDPADLKPEYVRDKVALTEAERAPAERRGEAAAKGRPAKGRPAK
jgi:tRNA threonylcarbamoyladenosine biosynthesis protein TsaB